MRLQYDIQATGLGQLRRVLRSVEQEQAASATRSANRYTRTWARTLAQVKRGMLAAERSGRAPGAPMAGRLPGQAQGAAGSVAERAGHQRRLRDIDAEGRRRARVIGDAASRERAAEDGRHRAKMRNIDRERNRQARAITQARLPAPRPTAGLGGTLLRSTGNALGTVGRFGTGLLALGGGFAAAGAIRNQMSVEAQSSILANKALGTPGEQRTREQIRADVMKQSRSLGASSGLGATGVIQALSNFTAISGNLKMGQQLAPFMADITDATGAAIEDVGRTAGQIAQNLMARPGADPTESMKQTMDIMAAMAGQAKVGSIEFADLATQMGKVMSATNGFEGDVVHLAKSMAGAAQLAIAGGASSPEEAMTSIKRFRDDLIQNQARFAKMQRAQGTVHGVSYFTDESATELRDPLAIMRDIMKTTKGSLPKMGKLFGIRAQKTAEVFQQGFVKGGGLKDVEAGMAAMEAVFNRIYNADMSREEITTSAGFRRQDMDKRLASNVERFNAEVGSKLLPALTDIVPKLEGLIPAAGDAAEAMASFASFFAGNPLAGMGSIVGALVAKDLVSGIVGKVSARAFDAALQTKLGKAGAAITVGMASFEITKAIINWYFDKKEKEQTAAALATAATGEAISAANVERQRFGQELSPETEARLKGEREKVLGVINAPVDNNQTWWDRIVGNPKEGPSTAERVSAMDDLARIDAMLKASADLQKQTAQEAMNAQKEAAAELKDAAKDLKGAGGAGTPSPDSPRRNSPIINRG